MKSHMTSAMLAVIGMLAAAPAARGQEGDSLRLGMRYRVTLPKLADVDGPQFPSTRMLMGQLVARRADSLVLRPHPTTGTVAVPLVAVSRLERSRGVSRVVSGVEGAVGGAIACVILGLFLYELDVRGSGFNTRWQAVGTMAANSAAGGLIVGALFPSERWRRVPTPSAP